MTPQLAFHALEGLPEIQPGDPLPEILAASVPAGSGILVVAQKIVSKAEGRVIGLDKVEPGHEAIQLAAIVDKDPRHVELVLRESVRVVRAAPGVLICETHHGFVCANAGVDFSNAPKEGDAVLLPVDPDGSARKILAALGKDCAVIISDTFGRPWREGLVDVAIGIAGMSPLRDDNAHGDRAGRELQVTIMALADQLAAAAGILMRKDAGLPAVWVQGVMPDGDGNIDELMRDSSRDLFR